MARKMRLGQKIQPLKRNNDHWQNDHLQFARLLAELCATNENLITEELLESMDLEAKDVVEILGRAQEAWDEWKNKAR
jgi:hypothetical protein